MAKTAPGSKGCSRCKLKIGNKLMAVEFSFKPEHDDEMEDPTTPKPVSVDLTNQNVRLCATCIGNGGKQELIDTILATSGIPRNYFSTIFKWEVKPEVLAQLKG